VTNPPNPDGWLASPFQFTVAHLLGTGTGTGAPWAWTLCGQRVRAPMGRAHPNMPRCKTCARIAGP
jgi:hypothetical protein